MYRAEAGLHEVKTVERSPVETKDWDEKRASRITRRIWIIFVTYIQTALQRRRTCYSGTKRRNDNGT
jgi:hypothetical protein